MKKRIYNIVCIISVLMLGSCHSFLHEYPKDQAFATSTNDFNELLVGEGYMSPSAGADVGSWIQAMDDDVLTLNPLKGIVAESDFYWWKPNPNTQSFWEAMYKRIGVINVIINDIDEFKDERGDGYRKVKGESHFLRATYYYLLVNIYGKPYSKEFSLTDLGVPLKLSSEIEDKRYSRNTVAECYEQMLYDLNLAIELLEGITPTTTYRAGEMAARHLLSRILLYMGEWEEVVKQCDTILSDKTYQLLDYNNFTSTATNNAISARSSETIFSTGKNNYSVPPYLKHAGSYFRISEELLGLYKNEDLRRVYYFRGFDVYSVRKMINKNDGMCSEFFLLRLPEILLNKAEALTVIGRDAEAIQTLQELRVKRYRIGTTTDIALNGEELMELVRLERRFEFTFEGQRWFDLRRYAVHPKWPFQKEIRHPHYTITNEIDGDIVLRKYDKEPEFYILPLPESEIIANSGRLIQNPLRTQKEAEL